VPRLFHSKEVIVCGGHHFFIEREVISLLR
jgi:hypothetical protein